MKRSMPYRYVLTIVALAVLVVFACGMVAAASGQKVFTENDNGNMVVVKKGEVFTVNLPENPSTGYSWNLTTGDGLTIKSDRYIPPAQQIPGRGGRHEWAIEASKAGPQKVSGIYKRPWEPATGSENTFQLNVDVTGSAINSTFPSLSSADIEIKNVLKQLMDTPLPNFAPEPKPRLSPVHFNFKDIFSL